MEPNALSRVLSPAAIALAGVIALGGCSAALPSPSPSADPSPSIPIRTPSPSKTPSAAVTPGPASPTPASPPAGVAGSWVRLADMSEPRWSFTALELLDGRVFVIDQEACNGMSELGGSPYPSGPTDLLDPATGAWTPASPLNATRSGFLAVRLLDGRVLVTGGANGWHGAYSSTRLFDPASGRWSATGLLGTARMGPVGALLPDGRVLVAGGTYSEGYKDEEDFNSGRDPGSRDLTSAELYDPKAGRWTPTGSMVNPGATGGDAYPLPDGRVLTVGGAWDWSGQPRPAEIYDPALGTWATAGSVGRLPGSASVVLADGTLLVIGGTEEVVTPSPNGDAVNYLAVDTVRRFDPATGSTVEVAPLPAPRTGAVAVRLADGRVLVAGGAERTRLESGIEAPATATAFLYDPGSNAWAATAPMPFADSPGQAVLLADGGVLVTGGSIPYPEALVDVCEKNAVGWTARFRLDPLTGG